MISNSRLKKQATDVSPESFELFSYIEIDKKHQIYTPFTQSLICTCVNSSETIIDDPDVNDLYNISPLRNNMTKPPLLKNRTTSQCNHALMLVMALGILCYAQNKRSKFVQKVNTQFAFANNILKRFIESFHQIDYLISYESLCCGL